MYNNPYKAYQKTQVTTAKPEKVLLMLYEGAIKFCKIAQVRMREKNVAEKGKYISKTLAIISELMNTLDHKIGGQLAQDLENLYMFMIDKLIEANIYNKPEELDVVERLLTTLYGAWEDVVNNPRPDGVPSPKLQPELAAIHAAAQQQASGRGGAQEVTSSPRGVEAKEPPMPGLAGQTVSAQKVGLPGLGAPGAPASGMPVGNKAPPRVTVPPRKP